MAQKCARAYIKATRGQPRKRFWRTRGRRQRSSNSLPNLGTSSASPSVSSERIINRFDFNQNPKQRRRSNSRESSPSVKRRFFNPEDDKEFNDEQHMRRRVSNARQHKRHRDCHRKRNNPKRRDKYQFKSSHRVSKRDRKPKRKKVPTGQLIQELFEETKALAIEVEKWLDEEGDHADDQRYIKGILNKSDPSGSALSGLLPHLLGRKPLDCCPLMDFLSGTIRLYVPALRWRVEKCKRTRLSPRSVNRRKLAKQSVAPKRRGSVFCSGCLSTKLNEKQRIDIVASGLTSRCWSIYLHSIEDARVSRIGEIPKNVQGQRFARTLSGITYDCRREVLWLFGLRRIIALDLNLNSWDEMPRPLTPVYQLTHKFDNLSMTYSKSSDSLIGTLLEHRVELCLR